MDPVKRIEKRSYIALFSFQTLRGSAGLVKKKMVVLEEIPGMKIGIESFSFCSPETISIQNGARIA